LHAPPPPHSSTLSLHDALPICSCSGIKHHDIPEHDPLRMAHRSLKAPVKVALLVETSNAYARGLLRGIVSYIREHRLWSLYLSRSEEHTSELQSLRHLVCRLLL